ncbi:DUF2726 domain-containing protein [Acrocarpospora corrugata]|uniref:DUF2726 domain-containing protein n=1 Tax=Acrocarpospora corrugata TaxID=35763 RepID=UPI003BEEEFF3
MRRDRRRRSLTSTRITAPHGALTILGNGRAVLIEVDGPHHYARTRKADDEDRDRHWKRCGIPTIRLAHQHTDDPASLKDRLREDLVRVLFPSR